jgi:hypothetical protein
MKFRILKDFLELNWKMISENWNKDEQPWAGFWPKAGHCWTGPMAKTAKWVEASDAARARPQAVSTPGASAVARPVRPCRRLLDGDINGVSTFDGWANRRATRGEGDEAHYGVPTPVMWIRSFGAASFIGEELRTVAGDDGKEILWVDENNKGVREKPERKEGGKSVWWWLSPGAGEAAA